MENKPNFTLITLNIQGLRNVRNRKTLFSWLNCAKPDIICLQETHSTSEDEFKAWVTTETTDNNNLTLLSRIVSRLGTSSGGRYPISL